MLLWNARFQFVIHSISEIGWRRYKDNIKTAILLILWSKPREDLMQDLFVCDIA